MKLKLYFPNAFVGIGIGFLSFLSIFLGGIHPSVDYYIAIVLYCLLVPFVLQYIYHRSFSLSGNLKRVILLLAFLFSQFVCIGESFHFVHDFSLCFGNWILLFVWILKSGVYTGVFFRIFSFITHSICQYEITEKDTSSFPIKRFFWINIAARVFVQILYFPCCFDYDGGYSLRLFLAPDGVLNAHHPFFVQLLQISFYRLGQIFGNPSIGMALLTLVLIAIDCLVIVYGLRLLKQMNVRAKWIKIVGYIFAFFPVFPIISINPTKDGMFAYACLLYFLTLLKLRISEGYCLRQSRFLCLHGLAILAVALTRHQGIYIVFLEFVVLLLWYRKFWKQLLLCSLPAIAAVMIFTKVILPSFEIIPGGKQEAIGMLFKQTALCLKEHPEDVTLSELASINQIMNADSIVARYTPTTTDYVKGCYKYFLPEKKFIEGPWGIKKLDDSEEIAYLKAYLWTWARMFLRHPITYIEAQLGIFYGYFYNKGSAIIGFDWVWMHTATSPEYAFEQNLLFTLPSNAIVYRLAHYPPFSWLFAVPYYLWIATILIFWVIMTKDYKGLVLFFPIFLSMCVLLICPVVDGRYIYPIFMALPFMLIYVLNNHSKNNSICQE